MSGYRPILRCAWCAAKITGLRQRGELGGYWMHEDTRREACPDGVTIAEPSDDDPKPQGYGAGRPRAEARAAA